MVLNVDYVPVDGVLQIEDREEEGGQAGEPDEGVAFFAMLGMARRLTGDLAFAASGFDVATMLATMTKGAPNVGVVYDNLATVRRLQKRWPETEQASDRAIAALETVDNPQALAGVYNNRNHLGRTRAARVCPRLL